MWAALRLVSHFLMKIPAPLGDISAREGMTSFIWMFCWIGECFVESGHRLSAALAATEYWYSNEILISYSARPLGNGWLGFIFSLLSGSQWKAVWQVKRNSIFIPVEWCYSNYCISLIRLSSENIDSSFTQIFKFRCISNGRVTSWLPKENCKASQLETCGCEVREECLRLSIREYSWCYNSARDHRRCRRRELPAALEREGDGSGVQWNQRASVLGRCWMLCLYWWCINHPYGKVSGVNMPEGWISQKDGGKDGKGVWWLQVWLSL